MRIPRSDEEDAMSSGCGSGNEEDAMSRATESRDPWSVQATGREKCPGGRATVEVCGEARRYSATWASSSTPFHPEVTTRKQLQNENSCRRASNESRGWMSARRRAAREQRWAVGEMFLPLLCRATRREPQQPDSSEGSAEGSRRMSELSLVDDTRRKTS